MNRKLLTPEIIIFLVLILLAVVLAGFLAYPLLSTGWRPFIAVFVPFIVAVLPFLWCTNTPARIWVYRYYYKLWGPTAEVSVFGIIPLNPEIDQTGALNTISAISKDWRRDAHVDARLENRIVIGAGPRTLTATVRVSNHSDDEETREDVEHHIAFELRGYETKVTRIDQLLQDETGALLDKIATSFSFPSQRLSSSFSLNITIAGRNPFLGFYLRDVPVEKIHTFQVILHEQRQGDDVSVQVGMDGLSIQARNARALISSARRYLASPTWAHLQ